MQCHRPQKAAQILGQLRAIEEVTLMRFDAPRAPYLGLCKIPKM